MKPQEFVEITEAQLLSHLGEQLHEFFGDNRTIWTTWDDAQDGAGVLKNLYQFDGTNYTQLPAALQKQLYFKRMQQNPASTIQPVAQCNMVANATFHLLAQQIAIVTAEMPELTMDKVLETSFNNIKKLVDLYADQIKMAQEEEAKHGKSNGEGSPAGAEVSGGVSS